MLWMTRVGRVRHPTQQAKDRTTVGVIVVTPHTLSHAAITAALNAGAHLRDVMAFARHADPITTMRYDRNRHSLDRHATYGMAQYIAGSE